MANLDFDDKLGEDADSFGISELDLEEQKEMPLNVTLLDSPTRKMVALVQEVFERCDVVEPLFYEWCERHLEGRPQEIPICEVRRGLDAEKHHWGHGLQGEDVEARRKHFCCRVGLSLLRYMETGNGIWLDRATHYISVITR